MKPFDTKTALAPLLLVVLVAAPGCGFVNRIRAKNALNEGAQAYRDGRFADAQAKFEYAQSLDPDQKNAPLFVARAIHQQYKPGVDTPENRGKAEAAFQAYKNVLEKDPGNEDAFNAIAYIYRQMRDEPKERDWLMQRANMESVSREKRSDAFTVLASKEWNCTYEITDQKENKKTINKADAVVVEWTKPQNQADFDRARDCALKGLELVEKAISLNPNNPNAWSYKTNLLREMAKLAQMEGKAEDKARYDREADEAEARQKKLNEEAERQKQEAEAQKAQQNAG